MPQCTVTPYIRLVFNEATGISPSFTGRPCNLSPVSAFGEKYLEGNVYFSDHPPFIRQTKGTCTSLWQAKTREHSCGRHSQNSQLSEQQIQPLASWRGFIPLRHISPTYDSTIALQKTPQITFHLSQKKMGGGGGHL